MRGRVVLYSLLAAGLAAAFYFNSNADAIYAQLGNRYYKQNNIKKAQEFYEKSFALGNKDTGVREIYVNSIILLWILTHRKNLSGLQRTIFKTLPQ